MIILAVLGRQPEISLAELQALFPHVKKLNPSLATFELPDDYNESKALALISRLGGSPKLAIKLEKDPISYLQTLPEGKLTLGVSDYSKSASAKVAKQEALKLKKILVRHGRSVRIIENKSATISTATSLHNGLSGKNPRKIEFIKQDKDWYRVIGVQDIDSYARRDQARPARDAKVGMLPPKLAQILINLCGPLKPGSVILDPFCGTGVVLQEALLIGYAAYGTDISDRMVDYSTRNLRWLLQETEKRSFEGPPEAGKPRISAPSPWQTAVGAEQTESLLSVSRRRPADDLKGRRATATQPEKDSFSVSCGNATTFQWSQPIDAVACEGYLGRPFSQVPSEMTLKEQKQACASIALDFLRNLSEQIKSGTPVTFAVPAWLRPDSSYERLEILDEITKLGYNVNNKTREGLLYHRNDQVVARDILILRKK